MASRPNNSIKGDAPTSRDNEENNQWPNRHDAAVIEAQVVRRADLSTWRSGKKRIANRES